MMQIHISKSLAGHMIQHLQPEGKVDRRALQWFAHQVSIDGTPCTVLMEQRSRYALLFCGLQESDYGQFPTLLRERLWREMAVVAQMGGPIDDRDLSLLVELVMVLGHKQSYQVGADSGVTAHMLEVADHLECLVHQEGYRLPQTPDEALRFGLLVNNKKRQCRTNQEPFVPIEAFRKFWLGLLEHVAKAPGREAKSRQVARKSYLAPNVIAVDFTRPHC